MFDSITKYTIVENPHPPQGGVPLFYIILLYWLPSTFPRHPRAELLQWLSSSHGLADQLGGLRHLDAALTVTILHEPAMSLATSPATPQFHDVLRNVFQKPTRQRLQSVKSVILEMTLDDQKCFFSKMMSQRTPLLGWLLSWYTDGARRKLVMCAGSFDGNTIPGTNG